VVDRIAGCYFTDVPGRGAVLRVSDTAFYQDRVDGIAFSYPSALIPDDRWGLTFADRPCIKFLDPNEDIRFEISLPPAYTEPLAATQEGVVVQTQTFNGLKWKSYSTPGRIQSCTFSGHEQVCIDAGVTPSAARISDALLYTIRKIQSTLAFHPSDRLDSQIAAVNAGQRFGSLTVKRVITMEMDDRMGGIHAGWYGELYFDGTVILTGTMDDVGTMLSGDHWEFDADFKDRAGWPMDIGREVMGCVEFRNGDFVEKQSRKASLFAPDTEVNVTIKNISVLFSPNRSGCKATADLVNISLARPNVLPVH